jgi:hypothetical protein
MRGRLEHKNKPRSVLTWVRENGKADPVDVIKDPVFRPFKQSPLVQIPFNLQIRDQLIQATVIAKLLVLVRGNSCIADPMFDSVMAQSERHLAVVAYQRVGFKLRCRANLATGWASGRHRTAGNTAHAVKKQRSAATTLIVSHLTGA